MNRLRNYLRFLIPLLLSIVIVIAGCSPKTAAPSSPATISPDSPAAASQGSTAASTEESAVTAVEEPGTTRVNPIPLNTLVSVPAWDIKVLELLRGDEALKIINTAEWQAQPLPEGQEYALAKVYLKCTALDENPHSLGISDMFISGSSNILYPDTIDGWPQPEFLFEDMYTADEIEGWIDAVIPTSEQNLMIVLNMRQDDGFYTRYFALQEGASISLSTELANLGPNDLGVDYAAPAPAGEKVITPDWEVTILASLTGAEAEAALGNDSSEYTPPPQGSEYMLMQVRLSYIGTKELPMYIGMDNFYPVDPTNGQMLQVERVFLYSQSDLEWLNKTLLPGAEIEGWVYTTIPAGSGQPIMAFDPDYFLSAQTEGNLRFLMIK